MFRSAEQALFANIVAQHIAGGTGPLLLEGGTGLGKTRAYLHALIQSGKRAAIVLPTHQLIEQLLASTDLAALQGEVTVAAFRPARMFSDQVEYEAQRQAGMAAQVMLCTAASVMIDQRLAGEYNGVTRREYILFDEADQLPEMAALQADLEIPRAELAAARIRFKTAAEAISAILQKPQKVPAEIRALARVMQEALVAPTNYCRVGLTDRGDVALTHKLPGRLLKKISNRPTVAFISATLTIAGSFNDFKRVMGIESPDLRSMAIEPAQHGRVEFVKESWEVDTPEWREAVIRAVAAAPRPVLVVTPSHELARTLGELLPGATVRGGPEETPAQAAERLDADGVLITAGAWAGLDTPLRWRTILVPKVLYPSVEKCDGEITTSYISLRNTATRRMRQVLGRGLRTPDAECRFIVLDRSAENLSGFIPARFATDWEQLGWQEGELHDVLRSERVRNARYRPHALKHYGERCMALDCTTTIKHSEQLDVHHRHPLADGERKTLLQDLMVLCAACHRLAHTRNPPYQLDVERVV